MTVVVPTQFVALDGRDLALVRSAKIKASQVEALAENTHYALASAGKRTGLQSRGIILTGLTSWTLIHKVPFNFAAQRELRGMKVAYRITNAQVKVTIRNSADSADLSTVTFSGSTPGVATIAAPNSSSVIIKVEAYRLISAAAGMDLLWVYERAHSTSTLPGAA